MQSDMSIRRLQHGEASSFSPAVEALQDTVEDTDGSMVYPDCKWHDPEWLSAWLRTHYLLAPHEQFKLCSQLLDVIHVPQSRAVLVAYMQELGVTVNDHVALQTSPAGESPSPIKGMGASEERIEHSIEGVMKTTFKRYPVPIAFLAFMLLFYAYQGVKLALGWIF